MKEVRKGMLLVISGPSGAGKGTLVARLLDADPTFAFSVSVTTRARRENEIADVHYHFISEAEYDKLLQEDAFIEQYVEGKVLRDEDSRNVYRLMREKAIYDLSYNVDPSGSLGEYKYFSKFVTDLSANPASYSQSIMKVLNKTYEKIVKEFMD